MVPESVVLFESVLMIRHLRYARPTSGGYGKVHVRSHHEVLPSPEREAAAIAAGTSIANSTPLLPVAQYS